MPGARSLYSLAKQACIKNIQSITDVGDIPYDHLRSVLVKLSNPAQLHELEKASPQLLGPDAELWHEFIKRDVENGEQKLLDSGREASYKMWRRLCRQEKEAMERDAEELAKQMQSIKDATAQRVSKVIDPRKLPKLPRMGGMRVEKPRSGGPLRHSGGDPSTLSFTSGSKTKTSSGQGVINKARREAKEMGLFSARRSVLATPTHQLGNKASSVGSAPKTLTPGPHEQSTRRIERPNFNTQASAGSTAVLHSSSPPQRVSTPPQPLGGFRVPRRGTTGSDNLPKPPARSRAAPSNPFMPPTKRRRVV